MELHKYKVGIMSHIALIEAPSSESAALFYGINTNGNATLMAVVYEIDGKHEGKAPLIEYQFSGKEIPEELVEKLAEEIKLCKILEWG